MYMIAQFADKYYQINYCKYTKLKIINKNKKKYNSIRCHSFKVRLLSVHLLLAPSVAHTYSNYTYITHEVTFASKI